MTQWRRREETYFVDARRHLVRLLTAALPAAAQSQRAPSAADQGDHRDQGCIGPKWNPATDDRGEVSFHDASETIDLELAAGPSGVFGAGAIVGKLSIGYTKIRLGHLYSDSVDSRGLDIGASVGFGSYWVTQTTWKKCSCRS